MKFKHELYTYQQDVLKVFQSEIDRGDKKIHIVAPPGSGKTIMGLEMISKLGGNHIILVPNITLQYQWRDKIEKFFLDDGVDINEVVSTSINDVKRINILTYQSLTNSNRENDLILDKIIDLWFKDYKDNFKTIDDFGNYVENLKEISIEEYSDKISKYKKKLKNVDDSLFDELLSTKTLKYIESLKSFNIKSIVVDEAHHLTNWWSKVVYHVWSELGTKDSEPFVIGLTATPPYDDLDFFTLDDDYSKLLGEVDYYIPTPAVVKSGRLAPWSDLVYFVEPGKDLKIVLENTDKKLDLFLEQNGEEICEFIYEYVGKNYDKMINKSYNRLINYLKFLKNYSKKDLSKYFFDIKINDMILLEDISKTVGKYISNYEINYTSIKASSFVKKTKRLFYDLGYIWRSANFYKFRTQIENMLIYSKSKIIGVKTILDKEILNLGDDLKCAIITDFLEDREGIINCKYILKELYKYKKLNPVLVSGQGIWKLSKSGELEEIETNILKVTQDLEQGKIKLVIGTRGILGEGWDCPKLNTLIDLTGIVAYMSVNQVRGRAIRLDRDNLNKVANIYDIVTYSKGYTKEVDLYRLERKHQKFYGVDDTGLIIRGVDHIYPNIKEKISDYKKINQNMLKRSTLKDYYYKLWSIGGDYQNKEIFGLDLEVNDIGKFIPFLGISQYGFYKLVNTGDNLSEISGKNYYFDVIYRFLRILISNIVEYEKIANKLPSDFSFNIIKGENGNFKIVSTYNNELLVKKFIIDLNKLFSTIVDQKYVLKYPFAYLDNGKIEKVYVNFGLPDILCKNKTIRYTFYDFIKINYNSNYISVLDVFLKMIFPFSKTLKLYSRYVNLYGDSRIDYVFINGNGMGEHKKEYIGTKPFIESKIEKIWI